MIDLPEQIVNRYLKTPLRQKGDIWVAATESARWMVNVAQPPSAVLGGTAKRVREFGGGLTPTY